MFLYSSFYHPGYVEFVKFIEAESYASQMNISLVLLMGCRVSVHYGVCNIR